MAGCAVPIAAASAADRRVVVDPDQPPWTAIVRVQTNIGSRCTGVLIAPATVLTAAHCIYNPRTQAFLQPVSLHVLFGYQRAAYRLHRLVKRFFAGPGFKAGFGPQRDDWARLELSDSVPESIEPLPLADVEPRPGMMVKFAGYNQDRAQLLMADPACRVIAVATTREGGSLIGHDCQATHGTSGAPLLVQQGSGWAVLGINIAASTKVNLALPVNGRPLIRAE